VFKGGKKWWKGVDSIVRGANKGAMAPSGKKQAKKKEKNDLLSEHMESTKAGSARKEEGVAAQTSEQLIRRSQARSYADDLLRNSREGPRSQKRRKRVLGCKAQDGVAALYSIPQKGRPLRRRGRSLIA